LVLGLVTGGQWHSTSVCNQPPRLTQPPIPSWDWK